MSDKIRSRGEQPFRYGERVREVPLEQLRPGDIIELQIEGPYEGLVLFTILEIEHDLRSGAKIMKVKINSEVQFPALNDCVAEFHETHINTDGFHLYNISNSDGTPNESMGNPDQEGRPYAVKGGLVSFRVFPNTETNDPRKEL